MSDQEISTVKKTWRLLREIDPVLLGDVFYSRLFMSNPELRVLFKSPIETQSRKLIDMLGYLISQLHRFDEVTDDVVALGQRHVQYGAKPQHYEAVRKALLWTLEKGLGRDWNDNVAQAWSAIFGIITQKMLNSTDQRLIV
ncbi:globin domain-containing protein [Spirosoma flavus]